MGNMATDLWSSEASWSPVVGKRSLPADATDIQHGTKRVDADSSSGLLQDQPHASPSFNSTLEPWPYSSSTTPLRHGTSSYQAAWQDSMLQLPGTWVDSTGSTADVTTNAKDDHGAGHQPNFSMVQIPHYTGLQYNYVPGLDAFPSELNTLCQYQDSSNPLPNFDFGALSPQNLQLAPNVADWTSENWCSKAGFEPLTQFTVQDCKIQSQNDCTFQLSPSVLAKPEKSENTSNSPLQLNYQPSAGAGNRLDSVELIKRDADLCSELTAELGSTDTSSASGLLLLSDVDTECDTCFGLVS